MNTHVIKRINITLPEETIQRIDKVVKEGKRSQFIDKAINFYLEKKSKAQLRQSMKERPIKRSQRDLDICAEWFVLEDEVWQIHKK
jgi:CopG family transcriptional regulator / antitoxin EndoAI